VLLPLRSIHTAHVNRHPLKDARQRPLPHVNVRQRPLTCVNARRRPSTHVTAYWRIHTIYANVICWRYSASLFTSL